MVRSQRLTIGSRVPLLGLMSALCIMDSGLINCCREDRGARFCSLASGVSIEFLMEFIRLAPCFQIPPRRAGALSCVFNFSTCRQVVSFSHCVLVYSFHELMEIHIAVFTMIALAGRKRDGFSVTPKVKFQILSARSHLILIWAFI